MRRKLTDPEVMPVWLWLPNLIGYVRWLFLFVFVYTYDTEIGLWSFLLSISLDMIDGYVRRSSKARTSDSPERSSL